MMSLGEVLKDVNTRKANLAKLGKELTADKEEARIAKHACQAVRSQDTKTRDFNGILNDANTISAAPALSTEG